MEGGVEPKLRMQRLEQMVPELRGQQRGLASYDGLRNSMETKDLLDRKLSCLNSIYGGLGRNKVSHLGQIVHRH